MLPRIGGKIERINGNDLSYEQFAERYMKKNEPVLITGLMDDWNACRDWVTESGEPNLHFLISHFGSSVVHVAECNKREFTDQKRVQMPLSEFITYWLESSGGRDQSLLYLKDWHFMREYPKYVAYTTPTFFADDWLNIYLDTYKMPEVADKYNEENEINCSDYRFVYMGPKGTWTPLHADVFRSYSWSANVCGRKQWYLLPPSQCYLLYDRSSKICVYDIFEDIPEAQFPGFKKTIWLECTQEKGEIIFVPSGWYHQVHNMANTISINHNWFNAYNVFCVWDLLLKDYKEAKEYIEDIRDTCDDFEAICQRNLAANTGMNFYEFFILIARFTFSNLTLWYGILRHGRSIETVKDFKIDPLMMNLASICQVASHMALLDAFKKRYTRFHVGEALSDSMFTELCVLLNRIHGLIDVEYEQGKEPSSASEYRLLQQCSKGLEHLYCLKAFPLVISSPEDLIKVIEGGRAILKCELIKGIA